MGVVRRNPVEELPQSLVALGPVAGSRAGRRLDAGRHVLGAKLLTRLVDVARLGGVQAAVDRRHLGLCKDNETGMRGGKRSAPPCLRAESERPRPLDSDAALTGGERSEASGC